MICNHTLGTLDVRMYETTGVAYQGMTTSPSTLDVADQSFRIGNKVDGTDAHAGCINEVIVFANALQPYEAMLYYAPTYVAKPPLPMPTPYLWMDFQPRDNNPLPQFAGSAQAWLSLNFLKNRPHNSAMLGGGNPAAWNGYVAYYNPTYLSSGGYTNDQGVVRFNRANSNYFSAGSKAFKIATNGGFTCIAFIIFTGTVGDWERIIDFGSGAGIDNIILGRWGSYSTLTFSIRNGAAGETLDVQSAIVQDTWTLFACRYNASTKLAEVYKDGTLVGSTTWATAVTDRTVVNTYVGKSAWTVDAYLGADLGGLYVQDRWLTDTEMSAVSAALMFPTLTSVPKRSPAMSMVKPLGYVVYQASGIGYRALFNGTGNCYMDLLDMPSPPWSIAFRYLTITSSQQVVVSVADIDRSYLGVQLETFNATWRTWYNFPTGAQSMDTATTTNTWHHIVVTVDANFVVTTYLDSVQVSTSSATTGYPAALSRLLIAGDGQRSRGLGLAGQVNDFRLYDRVLTSFEVRGVYNVAHWSPIQVYDKAVSQYVVNSMNWTTEMMWAVKSSTFTPAISGPPDAVLNNLDVTQAKLSEAGHSDLSTCFTAYGKLQDYDSFTASFEIHNVVVSDGAVYFFCGHTAVPTYPAVCVGGYTVAFSGSTGQPAISLFGPANKTYTIDGSTSNAIAGSRCATFALAGQWMPVTIRYCKGTIDTWRVIFNGRDEVVYSDPNNSAWLTTAGNNWGIGASSVGGASGHWWIRRIEVTTMNYPTGYSLGALKAPSYGLVPAGQAVSMASLFGNGKRGLVDGLTWKVYKDYSYGDVTYAPGHSYIAVGRTTDTGSLAGCTNGRFGGTGYVNYQDYFTLELTGYICPPQTGSWTFYKASDDGSVLWVGNSATLANLSYSMVTLGMVGLGTENSVTVSLAAGTYYPFRAVYGEWNGGEQFYISFTGPSKASKDGNGSGMFFSSTGTNPVYPAESAKVIKDITGTNDDGVYYIACKGQPSAPTYCLMNDTYNGGGWMMLMKATRGNTFQYSSNYWTTNNTLNTSSTDRSDGNAKFTVFNDVHVQDIMAIFPDMAQGAYTVGMTFDSSYLSLNGYYADTTTQSGSAFRVLLEKNNYNLSVVVECSGVQTPVHIYGLQSITMGSSGTESSKIVSLYARHLSTGAPVTSSTFIATSSGSATFYVLPRSGSIPIEDGWVWKLSNWAQIQSGLPMLDQLSTSGKAAATGAFACYRVGSYNGPTIRIRRSSDNAEADWYADSAGNMGTIYNGAGTALQTWLGSDTTYVTKWYDQSGKGNHATMATTTAQPTYDHMKKLLQFNTGCYLNMPSNTVPEGASAYTLVVRHGSITNTTSGGFLGAGICSASRSNQFRCAGDASMAYWNYWWSNDMKFGTTASIKQGNSVVVRYDGTNRTGYINGTLSLTQATSGINVANATQFIGRCVDGNTDLNGQLYQVVVFNTALTDADRVLAASSLPSCTTQKITALAGFQVPRDATPANAFAYHGFDGSVWSYQGGGNGARRHTLGGGMHVIPDGTVDYARRGFFWNWESDFNSCEARSGIGMSDGYSAGDYVVANTTTAWIATNRSARVELYGR